jgi:hypothetical protein
LEVVAAATKIETSVGNYTVIVVTRRTVRIPVQLAITLGAMNIYNSSSNLKIIIVKLKARMGTG